MMYLMFSTKNKLCALKLFQSVRQNPKTVTACSRLIFNLKIKVQLLFSDKIFFSLANCSDSEVFKNNLFCFYM